MSITQSNVPFYVVVLYPVRYHRLRRRQIGLEIKKSFASPGQLFKPVDSPC